MNDLPNELRQHIVRLLAKLPPTKGGHNPVIALLAGGLAGAVGCGLYLKSWLDGIVMGMLLIAIQLVAPHTPLLALAALSGVWTAMRAIQAGTSAKPSERHVFVDATPVVVAPPVTEPSSLFDERVGVKVLRG